MTDELILLTLVVNVHPASVAGPRRSQSCSVTLAFRDDDPAFDSVP
ncbi:MAG: hypothetical protein ABSB82_19815 [Terriglobia bacterium]|jgi:hypothetical protein